MKVRCPSHLLHDVVEFICSLTAEEIGVVRLQPEIPFPFPVDPCF